MPIDIIIPVFNEEEILQEKRVYYNSLKQWARIYFVDGGSSDRTVAIARKYGDIVLSNKGRAVQKNRGAYESKSEYLCFLHVDSYITEHALKQAQAFLAKGNSVGCFSMKIEDRKLIFRLYERVVNWRAGALGVFDGDLGLFIKREAFEQLGGFDKLPIMDDVAFGQKIKRSSSMKLHVLTEDIQVSSRKWYKQGFIKTFFLYSLAYIQLWTGIKFFT